MAQTIKLKRSATQGSIPATSALSLGEVAINTYDGKMYIKKSVGGTESVVEVGGQGGGIASSFTVYEYTATANQTTFSGSDGNSNTLAYDTDTPPKILVYLNGVLLDFTTDYTASNGTSIVLTNGASVNDLLQIAAYKSSISTTLDISLSDNQKLLLGNDDDLQIYHDGSNSRIVDTGTGNLNLQGTNLVLSSATGSAYLQGVSGGATAIYYSGSPKLATTSTGINVTGSATITDTSSAATALTIGSSSATSYTKQDWITSEHSAGTAYLLAYGASHSSQAGNFAIKNLAANKEIFFELSGNVEPLRLTSTGATVTGNITVSGTVDGVDIQTLNTTAGAALPKAGGTMTGNLTLSGTDPIITFQDTSANTDPSGRIVFSEISGTNNFDINYNGTNDRLEFRGLISSAQEDLVYINRSTTTPLSVLGSISVTGTVDNRDLATDGAKLDNIESNADVTDTANVTAAGALMDSEVTNLAQVKAFDSSDYATAAQGSTANSALQNVVEDTTPQLGGNLDLNSNNITGTGNINITGTGTMTGLLRALGGGDASFTSTTHAFQTGAAAGFNIIIDNNEIMARNNGASTNLLLQADGGNVSFRQNGLGTTNLIMGTTTFLDHSLNLSNIATISSGAITSSGAVSATEYDLPSGGMLDWANGDARIIEGLVNNYSLSFQTYDGSNVTTALRLDGNNTATFAGNILSPAGTAASPALQVGDTDSGFYDSGSDSIGLALGGVKEYEFLPAQFNLQTNNLVTQGWVRAGTGTVSAPSFQVGDDDSGFYDSGANEIGVTLGGVDEYEFTPTQFNMVSNNLVTTGTISSGTISSGNITTTGYLAGPATFTIDPAAVGDNTGTVVIAGNLQVDGTTTTINSTTLTVDDKNITLAGGSANAAAANGAGITVEGASATLTYNSTADNWAFNKALNVTGSVTATNTILNTGSTTVSAILRGGDGNSKNLVFQKTTGSAQQAKISAVGDDLRFTTGTTTERMRIDSSGNVGIGTTNPNRALHVEATKTTFGDTQSVLQLADDTAMAAGVGGGLIFTGKAITGQSDANTTFAGIHAEKENATSTNTAGALLFSTRTSGANPSERMRIDSSGNVGIGTILPTGKLDVNKEMQNATQAFVSPHLQLRASDTTDSTGFVGMTFATSSSPNYGYSYGARRTNNGQGDLVWRFHNNDNGGTEIMRLSQEGYLGLGGITDPLKPLHVESSGTSKGIYMTIGTGARNHLYADGTWNYYSGKSGNAHRFTTTGGADTVIANNGNVGIGIIAPISPLHIQDTSQSQSHTYIYQSKGISVEADEAMIQLMSADSGTHGGSLLWRYGDNAFGAIANPATDTLDFLYGVSSGNGFDLHGGGNMTSRVKALSIASDGRIGIGTDAPSANTVLHAKKGTVSTKYIDTSSTVVIEDTEARLQLVADNSGSNAAGVTLSNGSKHWAVHHRGPSEGNLLAFGYVDSTTTADLLSQSVPKMVIDTNGHVGIGTDDPAFRFHTYHPTTNVVGRFESGDAQVWIDLHDSNSGTYGALLGHDGAGGQLFAVADQGVNRRFIIDTSGQVSIGTNVNPVARLQVEALGIDTTTTTTSATTQAVIDTFAAATFRSARYTIQVTNSTDSTYHITEILLIHDGTTPQITEYGTMFTGSAEATFDADISSTNVRLLATPATTDSMTFKVVRHCITV